MIRFKILFILTLILLFGCANNSEEKVINIAVTGSPDAYSSYYKKGIERAYADVCREYKDSNFKIKCNFYDDKDNYEVAEKITASLVNDRSVTGILASPSPEICKNQAYLTNSNNKILVCTHRINDSFFNDEIYDKVFSLNYSSSDIGSIMLSIADKSGIKNWAICYSDDEISREEIKGFTKADSLNILDTVKINTLLADFNNVTDRWSLLGVEGVVIIPYEREGFEVLYSLKKKMPQLYIISDSKMDDDNELNNNREYFEDVYIVDDFYVTDELSSVFKDDEYVDTWEVQGYNAFRMIVDTAVKNNTDDPSEIAEILKRDGYIGTNQSFKFKSNGQCENKEFSYIGFTADDVNVYYQ